MNRRDFELVRALRALAHPLRLRIMGHLAESPGTLACDFADVFDVRQPTVSQHLKVLRDARLVETRRHGNQISYSVEPETLATLTELLEELSRAPAAQGAERGV